MPLLRLALWAAGRHPAPDTIPRSGPRTKGLNCYTTYLEAADGSWSLLVDAVNSKGISGRLLVDGAYSREWVVLWPSLKGARVEIIHYVGPYDFQYNSALGFLAYELVAWPKFLVYRNRIEQFFFNKKRLARTERIDVLRRLVERSLNDPQFRTSPTDFLADVHSHRSFSHPEGSRQLAYVQMLLDSLVDSGDLARENYSYSVRPHALLSLSAHEEDERRHRDNFKNQHRLVLLTLILALVGFAQALVAYLSG